MPWRTRKVNDINFSLLVSLISFFSPLPPSLHSSTLQSFPFALEYYGGFISFLKKSDLEGGNKTRDVPRVKLDPSREIHYRIIRFCRNIIKFHLLNFVFSFSFLFSSSSSSFFFLSFNVTSGEEGGGQEKILDFISNGLTKKFLKVSKACSTNLTKKHRNRFNF